MWLKIRSWFTYSSNKRKCNSWYKSQLPWATPLQISCFYAADHQGAGADVPPQERLPIMCHNGGSILWLVCPGGQVRHTHTQRCAHKYMCTASGWRTRPHMPFYLESKAGFCFLFLLATLLEPFGVSAPSPVVRAAVRNWSCFSASCREGNLCNLLSSDSIYQGLEGKTTNVSCAFIQKQHFFLFCSLCYFPLLHCWLLKTLFPRVRYFMDERTIPFIFLL